MMEPFASEMTLRDYFAAHCQPSEPMNDLRVAESLMGSDYPDPSVDPYEFAKWMAEWRAKWRYMQADAMMRARKT